MSLSTILRGLVPVALCAIALAAGWAAWRWAGVALVGGGVLMWALLHVTRMMKVLQGAANRPKGRVGSAVMLNAKLKKGNTLLHVMALSKTMGDLLTAPNAQPEVFRWTDGTDSTVTCTFLNGKLAQWELVRPVPPEAAGSPDQGDAGTAA
jgi:hypothetical protein